MSRFFKPYKGTKYDEGICGKKVLVLGASFYCNQKGCKFFVECTSPENKDSSKFDEICPYYAQFKETYKLSEEPSNAIDDCIKTYKTFAKFMNQFVEGDDCSDDYAAWDRMAFTEYLQFFSPTVKTEKWYLSQRDFDAFIETIRELRPDIIIAWGVAILEDIRENNPYVTDIEKLSETEGYVYHMRLPDIEHEITIINCYHPSSMSYWYNNQDKFSKYLTLVLKD